MNHDAYQPRFFVTASAVMISISSYIFSVSIGLPYIFLISSSILLSSIVIPWRVRYSDRSVVYSIVISLTLAVILDLLFPMDRDKFMLVGELLFINVTAPFLIYFCALITFFQFNVHLPGLICAISIAILLLTADVLKGGEPPTKVPFFSFSPRVLDKLFIYSMMIQIPMLLIVISYGKPQFIHKLSRKNYIQKFAILIFGLIFSSFFLYFATRSYRIFEDKIRQLENIFARYGFRTLRSASTYYASKTVDLRRPMSALSGAELEKIILRANSSSPPGYLRGRVYENYQNGSWLPVTSDSIKLNARIYEGILAYRTYFIGSKDKVLKNKIDFIYSPNFKTDILLVPGNYEQIEIVAERLSMTLNGVLTPEEWEKDGGYTVFYNEYEPMAAFKYPNIDENDFTNYLQIPEQLIPLIDKIISEIFPNREEVLKMKEAEIVTEIRNYFNSNYVYSLDFQPPSSHSDPLEAFFEIKRGHCELFATAAALVARRLGIPSRYITGFLCFEKHPSASYYVTRLENAHAWVETYLREEQKWTLLEATPEDGIPLVSKKQQWSFFKRYSDQLYQLLQMSLANVRRGFFAEKILQIIRFILDVLWELIWHPVRAGLFVLLFFLIYLLKKLFMRRFSITQWKIPESTLKVIDEYNKFEKKLNRIVRNKRLNSETPFEWLMRLGLDGEPSMQQIKFFIGKYNQIRFHPLPPSEASIKDIKKILHDIDWNEIKKVVCSKLT